MKSLNKILITIILITCSIHIYSQPKISVAIHSDTLVLIDSLIEDSQRPLEEIESLHGTFARRSIADLIILKKALIAGGYTGEFEYIEIPNAERGRNLITSGEVVISSDTFFSITFTDEVFKSSEVLPLGAFVKGIYCLESNRDLLEITTLDELKKFTAVSLQHWKVDWMTLEKIGLKELYHVNNHALIYNLIGKRGVDFSLLEIPPFSDINLEENGITLVPVPGLLIGLEDSRHYMISKRNTDSEEIYKSLELGLTYLREAGIIKKLMRDSGFYRSDLNEWKILNIN
jgi:hypothetical protein